MCRVCCIELRTAGPVPRAIRDHAFRSRGFRGSSAGCDQNFTVAGLQRVVLDGSSCLPARSGEHRDVVVVRSHLVRALEAELVGPYTEHEELDRAPWTLIAAQLDPAIAARLEGLGRGREVKAVAFDSGMPFAFVCTNSDTSDAYVIWTRSEP
ncbi:MAG: hypothetical protein ABI678_12475 [Kofleriaceae bacterium]